MRSELIRKKLAVLVEDEREAATAEPDAERAAFVGVTKRKRGRPKGSKNRVQ
jgi:hypothetical protein